MNNKLLLEAASIYLGLTEKSDAENLSSMVGVNVQNTPWCAAFMNMVLKRCSIKGTGSNLARSFLKIGTKVELKDAIPGDLVVFKRGNSNWQGHITLLFEKPDIESGYLTCLGGNQKDSVCIAKFKINTLLGIRRV